MKDHGRVLFCNPPDYRINHRQNTTKKAIFPQKTLPKFTTQLTLYTTYVYLGRGHMTLFN